jgi:hypothetical protein
MEPYILDRLPGARLGPWRYPLYAIILLGIVIAIWQLLK